MDVQALSSKSPDERDLSILQALASGQYAFGQYQTALDLLELAIKVNPQEAGTYVMSARIHYAIGNLDDAMEFLNMAVSYSGGELAPRDRIFERRIRLLAELAEQQRLFG